MSLPSIVLAPFIGAYDLLGIGYYSGPVEALSEYISNQSRRRGMVTADPAVDVAQQKHAPFSGNAKLQGPSVTLLVEFAFYKNEGLGAACEPSGFRLIRR